MSIGIKIQLVLAALALLGVGGFFAWMKLKPRSELGGPCARALDCAHGAEYCLKPVGANAGVCTKQCEVDADCGEGLVCKSTDIVETIVDANGDVRSDDWSLRYCFEP